MGLDELKRLRGEIAKLDKEVLQLVAKRLEIAAKIAGVKKTMNIPMRDDVVEKEVHDANRKIAKAIQVPESLALELTGLLIKASRSKQE